MGIRNYIKNERLQNRTAEVIENTSLGSAMEVFDQVREQGGAPSTVSVRVDPAPNEIDQKVYFEGVCERTAELVNAAPHAFAGRLALNQELTEEKSLTPIGLGTQGWLRDVLPEGGTLVFTPTE